MIARTLTRQEAFALTEPRVAYDWEQYGLTVVRDGYTEDGTRIHFVFQPGFCGGILANAYIFSI